MATARLFPYPRFRALNAAGYPLAGGKLTTWINGTSTLKDSFKDEAQAATNDNPVILDANGEADVWLDTSGGYKLALTDASDVPQWTVDRIFSLPTDISITDNTANAFRLQEGSNEYFIIDTLNGSENIALGNPTTNPTISLLGTGAVAIGGSVTMSGARVLGSGGIASLGTGEADITDARNNQDSVAGVSLIRTAATVDNTDNYYSFSDIVQGQILIIDTYGNSPGIPSRIDDDPINGSEGSAVPLPNNGRSIMVYENGRLFAIQDPYA